MCTTEIQLKIQNHAGLIEKTASVEIYQSLQKPATGLVAFWVLARRDH
jgi:hypothetical protein